MGLRRMRWIENRHENYEVNRGPNEMCGITAGPISMISTLRQMPIQRLVHRHRIGCNAPLGQKMFTLYWESDGETDEFHRILLSKIIFVDLFSHQTEIWFFTCIFSM